VNDGVKVAAIQMCSGDNLGDNLRLADLLLSEAARGECCFALLPENFAFMGCHEEDKLSLAEETGCGLIHEFLADAARRHQLWIASGSMPLKSPDPARCFAANVVFDATGEVQAIYRKIHLFDVDLPDLDEEYRESDTTLGGEDIALVDTPAGRVGLSVCYDLRFPEFYRRLLDNGATIFTVPAAFTEATGAVHWHTLLRARAIENLSYVIAAAQFGKHSNGRSTFGHSMIIDPWGEILAEKPSGNGVVIAEIVQSKTSKIRQQFPALDHRRL
jgi:predicted amidohydrolase